MWQLYSISDHFGHLDKYRMTYLPNKKSSKVSTGILNPPYSNQNYLGHS